MNLVAGSDKQIEKGERQIDGRLQGQARRTSRFALCESSLWNENVVVIISAIERRQHLFVGVIDCELKMRIN